MPWSQNRVKLFICAGVHGENGYSTTIVPSRPLHTHTLGTLVHPGAAYLVSHSDTYYKTHSLSLTGCSNYNEQKGPGTTHKESDVD